MQVAAARVGLQDATVGSLGIGARHQAQRPRLGAFGQHRRDRPKLPGRTGTQRDRLDPSRQLDIRAGRDQRPFGQVLQAIEQHNVSGQACLVHGWQRYALWPGHALQQGTLGQQRTGAQLRARHQGLRLAEQGAGGQQQSAAGIAHIGRDDAAGRQYQVLAQRRGHRQTRIGGDSQALDRQVIVKGRAGREGGAVGQGYAVARHHHRTATVVDTGQQHPALVIGRRRRRCEAVVDAAVDVQVTAGAQGQAAGFAGTLNVVLLAAVGVEAGVAETGQIQVALHDQVAVRRLADDFHAGTQVESIGVGGVVQPREFVLPQVGVLQRGRDKCHAQVMLVFQVALSDCLIRLATGGRVGFFRGIVVGGHAVEGDRARALDVQAPTGVDGNVIAAAVGIEQARRIQLQGAAIAPVVAGSTIGAVAQVDAHAIGEGQLAVAGAQHHHGAVGRVDDLAVAVHPQFAAMGVEHRRAIEGQAMLAGQIDAADLLTAGIHQAVHAQAAVIHGHAEGAGLEPVADGQVALLELEAAGTEDRALVEALVEVGELLIKGAAATQVLGLEFHSRGLVGHRRAAGRVITAGAAEDLALQVDDPGRSIRGHRPQFTRLVVLGRQVDGRARRLTDIAAAAVQQHVAAPAVLGHIVEGNGAAGHVDQRVIGQDHIAPSAEADLATGQHHRTGHANAVALQGQLGTLATGGATGACQRADINRTAGFDLVHRAGLTGHQRCADRQVAAAVLEAVDRVIRALALVDRQAALVVGGDALAGIEVDIGEPQCQAVETVHIARLGELAIAEFDTLGVDVQAPAAGARAARHHRARSVGGAQPDQVGGVDCRHIVGRSGAIHRRGRQHQVVQQ